MTNHRPYSTAYIDSANIEKGCEDLGFKIDLEKFKVFLFHKYNANRFVYFTGKIKSNEYYKEIENFGYEIIFKEAIRMNGKLKANCDVDIAHHMTLDIERKKVEHIIMCSGDGDFTPVIDFAKNNNINTNVVATNLKTCSYLLRKRNLPILYLDSQRKYIEVEAATACILNNKIQ